MNEKSETEVIIGQTDHIKLTEVNEAIHDLDGKVRQLEIALKLGDFKEKANEPY